MSAATILSGYLEVVPLPRRPRHRKPGDEGAAGSLAKAVQDLGKASVGGCRVLGVVEEGHGERSECWISHFGHSINCWPPEERRDHGRGPAPCGNKEDAPHVRRVFGYVVVVEGKPADPFGVYEVNPWARFVCCGYSTDRHPNKVPRTLGKVPQVETWEDTQARIRKELS